MRCVTLDTNIEWRIMDNKGTWDMGEDGQLRVIVSKYEHIWMHIKNIFCTITKRKLENPQQSKYLL